MSRSGVALAVVAVVAVAVPVALADHALTAEVTLFTDAGTGDCVQIPSSGTLGAQPLLDLVCDYGPVYCGTATTDAGATTASFPCIINASDVYPLDPHADSLFLCAIADPAATNRTGTAITEGGLVTCRAVRVRR